MDHSKKDNFPTDTLAKNTFSVHVYSYGCTNGITITLNSDKLELNPPAGTDFISQYSCMTSPMIDNQIKITIIVEVTYSNTSGNVRKLKIVSCLAGPVYKKNRLIMK